MKLISPAAIIALLIFLFSIIFAPIPSFAGPKGKKATWGKGFKQSDWQVGYGYLSCIKLDDALGEVEISDVSQVNVETESRTTIGSITAQITHRNCQKVSYGIALSYEQTKEDCVTAYNKSVRNKVGELTNRYITVTPLLRFNWIERSHVMFYSKLAIGVTFIGDKYEGLGDSKGDIQSKKQHSFGYQVSPIGFTFGSQLCGFIEAGYGSHGLVQAGVFYRF